MNKIKEAVVCNDEHDPILIKEMEADISNRKTIKGDYLFKPYRVKVYVVVEDCSFENHIIVFFSKNDAEKYVSEQENRDKCEILERTVF